MSKQECPQHQESDNGQVQPQQKAGPMIMQYITIDEITEILDELEVEYEVDLEETPYK